VVLIRRTRVHPFTARQIALLKTFADQAAIAIENARLSQELQDRNERLREALERETATGEILRTISSSPTDVQPVFAAVLASAARRCEASDATMFRIEDEGLRLVAHEGPIPAHEGSAFARLLGFRTILGVPLLRSGEAIGAITVRRADRRPFADRQVELLETFADQAVIAIENVRLFTELQSRNRELRIALEQQTATSELLKVIGRATFDLQPVFETLAENAVRLCKAEHAFIFRFDGQFLRSVATHNIPPTLRAFVEANPVRPGSESGAGRAAMERRTIHIEAFRSSPSTPTGWSGGSHADPAGDTDAPGRRAAGSGRHHQTRGPAV
jgi:hypothetical protein